MSDKDLRLGSFAVCLVLAGLAAADLDATEVIAWCYGAWRTWTIYRTAA